MTVHFHRHHVDACIDPHADWPDWAVALLATLDRRELQLMSANQDALDAIAVRLNNIEADLAASQAKPVEESLDFSGVQSAVDQLRALVPAQSGPIPAPAADPAPQDAPAADPAPAEQAVPVLPAVPLA